MKYFEKLSVTFPNKIELDTPVFLEETAIIKDTVDNQILLRNTFVNVTEESIVAIAIRVVIQDVFGEIIPCDGKESFEYIYQDIFLKPGELAGNKIAIELPENARRADVKIEKAVTQSGLVWNTKPFNVVSVQPQREIQGSEEFINTLDSNKITPVFYYTESDDSWQCTCGRVNKIGDCNCRYCRRKKDVVREIFLKENIESKYRIFREKEDEEQRLREEEENRKAAEKAALLEEERARQLELKKKEEEEQERKHAKEAKEKDAKKKKIIHMGIAAAAIVIIVLIGVCYTNLIKPAMTYNKAENLLSEEEYAGAIELFSSLGDYKDSQEKIQNALPELLLTGFNNRQTISDNMPDDVTEEWYRELLDAEEGILNCSLTNIDDFDGLEYYQSYQEGLQKQVDVVEQYAHDSASDYGALMQEAEWYDGYILRASSLIELCNNGFLKLDDDTYCEFALLYLQTSLGNSLNGEATFSTIDDSTYYVTTNLYNNTIADFYNIEVWSLWNEEEIIVATDTFKANDTWTTRFEIPASAFEKYNFNIDFTVELTCEDYIVNWG